MARRRPTAAQLREHRSKQLAIVLGLVFVVVAAIQVPRLLKELSPPKLAENAGTGLVATAPSGAATTGLAVGVATQLANFSKLPLKDPFHPLVSTPSASPTPPATPPKQTSTPKVKTAPVSVKPAAPTPFIAAPPNPPNAALIELNGQRQIVGIGDPFPAAEPLFKLVGLARKSVQIGVFAGSFSSGTPMLAIKKGHTITLVNQFDNTHYVLKLVGLTVVPESQTQTTTTTTTPTVTTAASP